MKAFRLLLIAALLLPAGFLRAQIDDRPLMRVDIPFAFTVENARLPAGTYVVYMAQLDHLWRLSSLNHKNNVFFHISAAENPALSGRSQLIFRHYPTDYVLREIDEGKRETAATISEGKRERQLASRSLPLETATIAAQSE
jgi:hypothetical protein